MPRIAAYPIEYWPQVVGITFQHLRETILIEGHRACHLSRFIVRPRSGQNVSNLNLNLRCCANHAVPAAIHNPQEFSHDCPRQVMRCHDSCDVLILS
jgi:hypothetical protein